MEITLAMFVLVFGILGIMAVFPVGLDSSRQSIENTTAGLIGQSVLEYLKVDGTLATIADTDGDGDADVYSPWPDFAQPTLMPSDPSDETGKITSMASASDLICTDMGGASPNWPDDQWNEHVLMLVSGPLRGKVYEIADTKDQNTLVLASSVLNFNYDEAFPDFDIVDQGTHFTILGKAGDGSVTGNTLPQNFFSTTPNLRLFQIEQLEKDAGGDPNADYAVPADSASTSVYSYVVIFSGYLPGSPNLAPATILVYKNYEDFHSASTQRPEQNRPPIAYFNTIISR